MLGILFAMEETALQSFVNFKADIDKAQKIATPEQIDNVRAAVQKIQSSTGQAFLFDEESGDAIIPVSGTLTPKPEICVSLHDGSQTLYPTIVDSIQKANQINSVKRIVMPYSTPGGYVDGVEGAAIAIKNSKKQIIAQVGSMSASAGYWLASQSNEIVAESPLSSVGSIGVLVEVIDRSKYDEKWGIKRFVLTSKNAPEKFPEVGTKEGRNKIIARLTDIEKVFISRVAEGRGVSIDKVKSDFGRGGVFTAEDALSAGMIDRVENQINNVAAIEKKEAASSIVLNSTPATPGKINKTQTKDGNTMETLQEFLDKNLEAKKLYDSNIAAAVKGAVDKINARIEAAKNYLANDKYPTLSTMALQVVTGETDATALTASVAAIDAMTEKNTSDDAKGEGDELPETAAQTQDGGTEADAEANYQAKKNRINGDA